MEELQELTIISLNIRAFNSEEKHHVIGQLIHDSECHVVCLNETKLTIPMYLDNYWSHQTLLQRNGGTWTAETNKVKLTLVKALGDISLLGTSNNWEEGGANIELLP